MNTAHLDNAAGSLSWPMVVNLLRPIRNKMLPAAQAAAAPASLLDWGRTFLPAHFAVPPSSMHRWLADSLDRMDHQAGLKLNLLGPRGSAKSTVATLAFALRAALEDREPYIWIISDTRYQARAHLENLKNELVENRLLAASYPNAVGSGPRWCAGAISLRNGVTVEAFGTGQRIRGRRQRHNRPTLILCDDLQNDGHMRSSVQRERSSTWFHGTLLKAGTPQTNVVNLATALHTDALALQLHRTPGWISRIFRAIETWPRSLPLWQQWESLYADPHNPNAQADALRFYHDRRAEMDDGAVVLWPERENLYTLMCMRAESGRTAFEREKQNSPIDPEACEWPEAYFGEHLWFNEWPQKLRLKILTLDPSKGADARRGDFSAIVRLGIDAQGVLYVEADLARRPTPQIVADGVAHYRQFRPDAFGVEANQFQELLGEQFVMEFRRQGLLSVQPWMIDNTLNKLVRIRRLGPHLSAHRFRMKADSPGTQLLVDQLRQFPVADHDDGPDALEMAVRLAAQIFHGRSFNDGLGNRLPVG